MCHILFNIRLSLVGGGEGRCEAKWEEACRTVRYNGRGKEGVHGAFIGCQTTDGWYKYIHTKTLTYILYIPVPTYRQTAIQTYIYIHPDRQTQTDRKRQKPTGRRTYTQGNI